MKTLTLCSWHHFIKASQENISTKGRSTTKMNRSAIYVIIVCSFLMQRSIIEADSYLYHLNTVRQTVRLSVAVTHAVAYLLYPLLGWLSDVYFTRYKVIRLSFIIMCVVGTGATCISNCIWLLDSSITGDLVQTSIVLTLGLPMLLHVGVNSGIV